MANELNILLSTGRTITADILNGSTVTASNISLSERGTTGHYFGNISALAAGSYFVVFKEGSTLVGYGELYWDGTKETINKLDADISTRATQTSVNSIPVNPLLTNDGRLANLDATISSRLASAGYTAPDNAGIGTLNTKISSGRASNLDNLDATISTRATQTSVNAIPTNPLLTNDSRLNNLTTIELIRKLITNTSKIDELTNRLIVYDDDGVTPILQFNTKDSDGVDSTTEIFEIRKI